jgi:NADH:ubiquinone oxidoreductase subunit 6 (subunit J)
MTLQVILFLVLSVVVLGSALFVVTTRNLFRGALMLVLSFFGVAGFYVLLDAGLFAVAQILIYIGAISILIIFSVMLTRGMQGMEPRNAQYLGAAIVSAIIFGALLFILGPIRTTFDPQSIPLFNLIFRNATPREVGGIVWAIKVDQAGALLAVPQTYIADFGRALVDINQYLLPFLLVALMVDIALSGAIHIARQRRPQEVIADRQEMEAEIAQEREAVEAMKRGAAPALPETAVAAGSEH